MDVGGGDVAFLDEGEVKLFEGEARAELLTRLVAQGHDVVFAQAIGDGLRRPFRITEDRSLRRCAAASLCFVPERGGVAAGARKEIHDVGVEVDRVVVRESAGMQSGIEADAKIGGATPPPPPPAPPPPPPPASTAAEAPPPPPPPPKKVITLKGVQMKSATKMFSGVA